ncbi:MAG: late competence development ComFB family protein, partial [Oscillospiraceae bacterium]
RSHKIPPMHGVISAKDLPRGKPVFTYKPLPDPPVQKAKDDYMVVPEISPKPSFAPPPSPSCKVDYPVDSHFPARFDLLKDVKTFTPELFFDPDDNDKFPDSYFTEKEKNKMSNYDMNKHTTTPEDYICVNVVEEITAAMLADVMGRFDLCTCEKCKADVMAIALNDLTPKYVGTYKGQLFVKLAGYEKQYSTDVLSALTKACIHVKSNPRHE